MYDLFPIDCLPWILVAFFLGYNGEAGVNHLRNVVSSSKELEDETQSDTQEDTQTDTESPYGPGEHEPREK